jgi:hypothetical protein
MKTLMLIYKSVSLQFYFVTNKESVVQWSRQPHPILKVAGSNLPKGVFSFHYSIWSSGHGRADGSVLPVGKLSCSTCHFAVINFTELIA